MKNCELCKGIARMHCESDRASLCWSCDYKVHSANFLVARHSRTLLCHVCQSPTPWTAAGLNIGPTVSVCDSCVPNFNKINAGEETEATNNESEEDLQTDMESDDFDDDEEEEEDNDEDDDTDCEDNQVVPWYPSSPPPASPSENSPSNGDEEEPYSSSSISSPCDLGEAQRKRTRENADLCFNVNCASKSQGNADTPPTTVEVSAAPVGDGCGAIERRVGLVDSLSTIRDKNLKRRRTGNGGNGLSGLRSCPVIESVKKLHDLEMRSGVVVATLCRLTEDSTAVDSS